MEGQKTCETCKFFEQHYTKHGNRTSALNVGHCVEPRLKDRKTDTPACQRYCERKSRKAD